MERIVTLFVYKFAVKFIVFYSYSVIYTFHDRTKYNVFDAFGLINGGNTAVVIFLQANNVVIFQAIKTVTVNRKLKLLKGYELFDNSGYKKCVDEYKKTYTDISSSKIAELSLLYLEKEIDPRMIERLYKGELEQLRTNLEQKKLMRSNVSLKS